MLAPLTPPTDQETEDRRAIAAELAAVKLRLEGIVDALPESAFLRENAVQARIELPAAIIERLVDDLADPRHERNQ